MKKIDPDNRESVDSGGSSETRSTNRDAPKFFNLRKNVKVWECGLFKNIVKMKLSNDGEICAVAIKHGTKISIADAITGETRTTCHRGINCATLTKIDFTQDNSMMAVCSTRLSIHLFKLNDADNYPIMKTGITSSDVKSFITIKPAEIRARKMSGLIEERPFSIDLGTTITIPNALFANPVCNPNNAFEMVILGESGHAFRVGQEKTPKGGEEKKNVDLLMKIRIINLS